MIEMFDDAGYIGVVATNCEQTYDRYLRLGEEVSVTAELDRRRRAEEDRAGRGVLHHAEDHLVRSATSTVADMMLRILKFRPADAAQSAAATVPADLDAEPMMRPAVPGYRVLLGRRQRRTSCASSAGPTEACSTRRCPRCGRTGNCRSTTSSPAARAPSSATSCTTRRRCPGAQCRS